MRPLLVGMNNPLSIEPRYALYPLPVGCTGNRIWRMINMVRQMPYHEYVEKYDRTNLVTGAWTTEAARRALPELLERLPGRRAVLFGAEIRSLLKLNDLPLTPQECYGAQVYCVPHPSGRNYWYNVEKNRRAVGELLVGILEEKK